MLKYLMEKVDNMFGQMGKYKKNEMGMPGARESQQHNTGKEKFHELSRCDAEDERFSGDIWVVS